MADRPLTLGPVDVRNVLAGRKTQHRLVLGFGNSRFNGGAWDAFRRAYCLDWEAAWCDDGPSPAGNPGPYLHVPYAGDDPDLAGTAHRVYPAIRPGDWLWVREVAAWDSAGGRWCYRADGEPEAAAAAALASFSWQPACAMPRKACRVMLHIAAVRLQRLRAMSEADVEAEGLERDPETGGWWGPEGMALTPGATSRFLHAQHAFAAHWDSAEGGGGRTGWGCATDPWVIVVEFEPMRRDGAPIGRGPAAEARRRTAAGIKPRG